MFISAWVRDKIGVIWGGIERGWCTSENTSTDAVHTDKPAASRSDFGLPLAIGSNHSNNNRSADQRAVRWAGGCLQYGRSYYMNVAIRNGRYGVLVSSGSAGRKTGSLKRESKYKVIIKKKKDQGL